MDQDLVRHINAAKHDCNIVGLLRFCTHLQILPDHRYKVLWPAVYKLLKHAAYMPKEKDRVYQILNFKFYKTLRCEYDKAHRSASYIRYIPGDLLATINLFLTCRSVRNESTDMFPKLLGMVKDINNVPTSSRGTRYQFKNCQVDVEIREGTYRICSADIGCEWNAHKCQTLTQGEFERDYPRMRHGIKIWNGLPIVNEP